MKNTNQKFRLILKLTSKSLLLAAVALFLSLVVNAQTTLFNFQGKLPNDVVPATDVYEMEFKLFDAATDGTQIGVTNAIAAVEVKNRVFSVWLDYGAAAFSGADRFIEISYRRNSNQRFIIVSPREWILSVPYSIRSLTATTADNALTLDGLNVSNFVQTNDSRLSDDRNPLPGSDNYIQNTTVRQDGANFNISGNGTASILTAVTQFNLGGIRPGSNRILSSFGGGNLFVGFDTGMNNPTGDSNTFVGNGAGAANGTGRANTFVGTGAGNDNTTGQNNTFFGAGAGSDTTLGGDNTFVGSVSGANNGRGRGNTFIGFGSGFNAPTPTTLNTNNTLIGFNTKINPGVFKSTGIGANVVVTKSNTIVIGTEDQTTFIPGGGVSTFNVDDSFSGIIANNLIFRHLGRDIPASSSPVCFRITSIQTPFGFDGGNGLTNCNSSSSLVFKTDVKPFTNGLDVIKLLKPVAFRWKSDGIGDVGLNTEDVAAVAPQLVRSGGKGEVGDINPNSFNALFINSFKEQQAQIEAQEKQIQTQREQIERQQQEITALKKLVCQTNAEAALCKAENGIADRLPVRSPF